MSKFETMINKKTDDGHEATTEKHVLEFASHAKNELNQNKANQKSVAEHVVKEYLMEGTQQMIIYANLYKKSFNEMCSLQSTIIESSKNLTQKSKDYANQVGEALARIDKVLVKDFEVKLLLLERFVVASKEMAELERSGALQKIAVSFGK